MSNATGKPHSENSVNMSRWWLLKQILDTIKHKNYMAFKSNRYEETSLEISVRKDDLLVILKRNRAQHNKDFERCIYFWQKYLKKVLSEIKAEECFEFPEKLESARDHCPESCVKEYDDVIDMFEMSINDTIILTTDAYRKYCKDEWEWKTSTYRNWYYKNLARLEAEEAQENKGEENLSSNNSLEEDGKD